MSSILDAATGALLSPFFAGGTKRMVRAGIIDMVDVQITPPLLQILLGETGAVLPMRLERVFCSTLKLDLVRQSVEISELHLVIATHDPPGLDATRADVDNAVRRLIELSNFANRGRQCDLCADAAAAVAPVKTGDGEATFRRWADPITAFLNLTSAMLLPRIHIEAFFMHQSHLQRCVTERPFGFDACLAEVILLWLSLAYPGAGATPGYAVVPATPPRPWHNGPVAGGGARPACPAADTPPAVEMAEDKTLTVTL